MQISIANNCEYVPAYTIYPLRCASDAVAD